MGFAALFGLSIQIEGQGRLATCFSEAVDTAVGDLGVLISECVSGLQAELAYKRVSPADHASRNAVSTPDCAFRLTSCHVTKDWNIMDKMLLRSSPT